MPPTNSSVQPTVISRPVVAEDVAAAAASLSTPPAASPPDSTPAATRASTIANPIQPSRSLTIAELMISMPMSERNMFRSIRILAITGSAVIDIAIPRNNANGNCLPSS